MMRPHKSTQDRIGACLAALTLEDLTTAELAAVSGFRVEHVRRSLDCMATRGWVSRSKVSAARGRHPVVWSVTEAGRKADAAWENPNG